MPQPDWAFQANDQRPRDLSGQLNCLPGVNTAFGIALSPDEQRLARSMKLPEFHMAKLLAMRWPERVVPPQATCERCSAVIETAGTLMEVLSGDARAVTSDDVLVSLEITHALAGCDGALRWAAP